MMAKLYFKYGVMGSSKTANAIMTVYNYNSLNQKALIVKPEVDNRTPGNIIESRTGIRYSCLYFSELRNLDVDKLKEYAAIIVDEAQFLTTEQVDWLTYLVDDLDIPVLCYGLRADSMGHLFEGSKRLFEVADSIQEIKTVCWCGRKATYNARFDTDGNVIKSGNQIEIGANDKYIGLCRKHWKLGDIGEARKLELGIHK